MPDRIDLFSVAERLKNVPVEGFWSVSVYNADGYFEKNPYDAYNYYKGRSVPRQRP